MWRIIIFLFTGKWHICTWEIIKEGPIVNTHDQKVGYYYNSKCTVCGNLKRDNFYT